MSAEPAANPSAQLTQTRGEAVYPRGLPVADDLSALGRVLARPWPLVVWAALIFWSAFLFVEVRSDYLGFRLARFDLGNMVQAVWSTAHGRPLETTLLSGEQALRLDSHVDPILVLFAPFFLVWPSPLLLAGVQIAACALGALPVFWIARRHLASEKAAALLALAYLAYPWLAWTALDAMHPVTLAIPLFLYAIWFLDSDRLWPFALCALLIAATGELMGLSLASLGLWYWLARGNRRFGLLIATTGFAWTLLALKVVIPAFHGSESPYYERFVSVGGSPEGIFRTLFTDPGRIASALVSEADLVYYFWLGIPLGGLFLLAPGLAAVALPQLLANGLSDLPSTTLPQHHYIAAVIPFLIVGAVVGILRLPGVRHLQAALIVLVLCFAFNSAVGPWPGARGGQPSRYHEPIAADRVRSLRSAVALVPDDAPVSATNTVGSHFSARRHIYLVPVLGRSEWIVIDETDSWIANPGSVTGSSDPRRLELFLQRIEKSPKWRRMFAERGVFVFRKYSR